MKIPHNRTPHQVHKHSKRICATSRCIKPIYAPNWYCHSCIKERQIAKDPILYAYRVLMNNAKRRGKEFTLTIEYFTKLVKENDYMRKRGTTAKSLQIDRMDETKGYTDDNVRCITLRQNVIKYHMSKKSATLKQEVGF